MPADINNVIVLNRVDTGDDGNIMQLHIYKKLFPGVTSEQLTATEMKVHNLKCINNNNNSIRYMYGRNRTQKIIRKIVSFL